MRIAAGLVLLLATVTPAAAQSVLTQDGFAELRIGMPLEDVKSSRIDHLVIPGGDFGACIRFPVKGVRGLTAYMRAAMLTQLVADQDSDVVTDRGIRIGSRSEDVLAAYSGVRNDGGYDDEGRPWLELFVQPDGRRGRGLKFTIDNDGRVSSITAGGPEIEWRGGCP